VTFGSLFVLVSVLMADIAVGAEQEPTSKSISNTTQAQCLIKITCDPETLLLNEDTIKILLTSPRVGVQAAREVLGMSGDLDNYAQIYFHLVGSQTIGKARRTTAKRSSSPGGAISDSITRRIPGRPILRTPGMRDIPGVSQETLLGVVQLQIFDSDSPARAEELLASICARLEKALVEANNKRSNKLQEQAEFAEKQYRQANKKVMVWQSRQRRFTAEAGVSDLSRGKILDEIRGLEKEKRELEMDMAGLQARREALEKQIGRRGDEASKKLKDDPVARELEEIVKVREIEFRRVGKLVAKGVTSERERNDAREKLARAKAELALRREALTKRADGDVLGKFNTELAELSIELAEQQGRLKMVNEHLARIRDKKLLALADEFEREVMLKLPLAMEDAERAFQWHSELRRQKDAVRPPTVTVIGGK